MLLINNHIKNDLLNKIGTYTFLIGVFFLPSSLLISIIFLLPAAIIGGFLKNNDFFKDKWNYPFLLFGIFISLSAFIHVFITKNTLEGLYDPKLSLIGLVNWLPFIWFFWSSQVYLNTKLKRKVFGKILISSTFPVLITGLGQYFFNWNGPLQSLSGLIIWYQKPIQEIGGLSGLFSNPNYAGSWLIFVWPFCIALFIEKYQGFFKKTVSFSFLFSVFFAAILTGSKNAWLGLITTFPIVVWEKAVVKRIGIIILILIILITPILISTNLKDLIKEIFYPMFLDNDYETNDKRISIYISAINFIKLNPLIGFGASSFPILYEQQTNLWKGHSHNLIIELILSYGLPGAITLITTIFILIFRGYKEIFFKKYLIDLSIFDKALWAALFYFLFSQLIDIQYFDGKISILAWFLLAGVKVIIEENQNNIKA